MLKIIYYIELEISKFLLQWGKEYLRDIQKHFFFRWVGYIEVHPQGFLFIFIFLVRGLLLDSEA